MAHRLTLRTGLAGLVVGALALLPAACGGSPAAGVASVGKTVTTPSSGTGTTLSSASAVTSGSGDGGGGSAGAANGGAAGPVGHTVMRFPGASYSDALKYSHCMRSHGVVDFPDPAANGNFSFSSANGIDPGSSQFQAANKTCEKLMPNGGQPTAAQQAAFTAQALKFSKCMQAHGIRDFPDPTSQGLQVRVSPGSDLDPNNPKFQAAQSACQGLMPGGGPNG
ncbi:MAG TPA: hypothetical protein VME46_18435 [Acidimicrobiales bacterium]|nr:hypothetical protein [Acidimicrobiales bacterium]